MHFFQIVGFRLTVEVEVRVTFSAVLRMISDCRLRHDLLSAMKQIESTNADLDSRS